LSSLKNHKIEEVGTSLTTSIKHFASHNRHHEVLAARETDLEDGKEQFSDWESAKEKIRESVK
jgi:hypothetical protein